MAWKQLAFVEDVLTNPMTANLDMADYQITGVDDLRSYDGFGIAIRDDAGTTRALLAGSTGSKHSFLWPIDMDDNDIVGANAIHANATNESIKIYGGSDTVESNIEVIGSTAAANAGLIGFTCVDAAKTSTNSGGYFDGATDTPILHLNYGLDMNQKEIGELVFENLATAPHSGTEVQGEVYYDTADDHLHVWVV